MKTKTSMTDITRSYDKVYRCGYCDLQYLFSGEEARFYNCGVYGWNCDIFTAYVDGKSIAVTTGYRNMRGERIPGYIVKAFESAAKSILCESYSYKRVEKHEELRRVFFNVLADLKSFEKIFDLYAKNYISYSEAVDMATRKGA